MIIKEALKQAVIMLKNENIEAPKTKARMLLQATLKKPKEYIIIYDTKEITSKQREDYIKNGLSLRELEAKTGIPKSTLHENIHKVADPEFQDKLDNYTKGL